MEQKFPLSLRNLSKNAFKRKIEQKLTNVLTAENSYFYYPKLIQKMKSFLVRSQKDGELLV